MSKTELFTNLNAEFEELYSHFKHCLEEEDEISAREHVIQHNNRLSERGKADKLAELSDRRFSCRHEKERCISRLEKLIEAYKKAADNLDRETVLAEPLDTAFSNMLYSNLLTNDELIALSRSDRMKSTLNRRALLNVMGTIAERKDSEEMRIAAAELKTRYSEPQTAATVEQLGGAMWRIFNNAPEIATAIYQKAYKPAISQLVTDGSENGEGE